MHKNKYWISISPFLRRSLSSVKPSPWLTRVCQTVSRTMAVSSPRHQGSNLSTSLQMWPVSCSWRKGSVRRLPIVKCHLYHRGTWNTETRTIVPSTWTVWRLTYSDHWNCRLKSIGQKESTCMRTDDGTCIISFPFFSNRQYMVWPCTYGPLPQ